MAEGSDRGEMCNREKSDGAPTSIEINLDIPLDDLISEYDFRERDKSGDPIYWLGGGSFGDVYRAKHKEFGDVAVKVAGSRFNIQMYKKEAKKYGSVICSPFIVLIRGYVESANLVGIVMELMQGSLWDLRVEKLREVPPKQIVCRMAHHMASGMRYLHSKSIFHRDLKLQNVLYSSITLNVKIADLGLSVNLESSKIQDKHGTASHKPPEAFDEQRTPDDFYKYDVYSYGCTLYELLAGINPYPGRGFDMLRILKQKPEMTPRLEQIPHNSPPELLNIMTQSWSFKPEDRPKFKAIALKLDKMYTKEKYEESLPQVQAQLKANAEKKDELESMRERFRNFTVVDDPKAKQEQVPEPMQDQSPEPMQDQSPEPIQDQGPEPIQDQGPEPIQDQSPEPIQDQSPEPIQDQGPKPIQDQSPEPIQDQSPEPMQDQGPEPMRDQGPEPNQEQGPKPIQDQGPKNDTSSIKMRDIDDLEMEAEKMSSATASSSSLPPGENFGAGRRDVEMEEGGTSSDQSNRPEPAKDEGSGQTDSIKERAEYLGLQQGSLKNNSNGFQNSVDQSSPLTESTSTEGPERPEYENGEPSENSQEGGNILDQGQEPTPLLEEGFGQKGKERANCSSSSQVIGLESGAMMEVGPSSSVAAGSSIEEGTRMEQSRSIQESVQPENEATPSDQDNVPITRIGALQSDTFFLGEPSSLVSQRVEGNGAGTGLGGLVPPTQDDEDNMPQHSTSGMSTSLQAGGVSDAFAGGDRVTAPVAFARGDQVPFSTVTAPMGPFVPPSTVTAPVTHLVPPSTVTAPVTHLVPPSTVTAPIMPPSSTGASANLQGPIHQTTQDPQNRVVICDASDCGKDDYEIHICLSLQVKSWKKIKTMDQVLGKMQRCSCKGWWSKRRVSEVQLHISTISSSLAFRHLTLPSEDDEDEYIVTVLVHDKTGLEELWKMNDKEGKLNRLCLGWFADDELYDVCQPTKPEIKIHQWNDQYQKGLDHFQKVASAPKSKDTKRKKSAKQKKKDKPRSESSHQGQSKTINIQKGSTTITMNSAPTNMYIGDQHHTHYHGRDGSSVSTGTSYQSAGGAATAASRTETRSHQPHQASTPQPRLPQLPLQQPPPQPPPLSPQPPQLTVSTKEVSQDLMAELSKTIPRTKLPSLGRYLKLSDIDVENTLFQYKQDGPTEEIYQVLRKWRAQNGRIATETILAHALWNADCHDAARCV